MISVHFPEFYEFDEFGHIALRKTRDAFRRVVSNRQKIYLVKHDCSRKQKPKKLDSIAIKRDNVKKHADKRAVAFLLSSSTTSDLITYSEGIRYL